MDVWTNVSNNMWKSIIGAICLVVTTAMVASLNKPTKEYVDFQDSQIRKELMTVKEMNNVEFRNLERTIKMEMDALRKNIEDWRKADKDKYELIIKLIEKDQKQK